MFESVIRVHISVIYLHLLYDKLSIFAAVSYTHLTLPTNSLV